MGSSGAAIAPWYNSREIDTSSGLAPLTWHNPGLRLAVIRARGEVTDLARRHQHLGCLSRGAVATVGRSPEQVIFTGISPVPAYQRRLAMTEAISSAISSMPQSEVRRATLSASEGLLSVTSSLEMSCQIGSRICLSLFARVTRPSSSYCVQPLSKNDLDRTTIPESSHADPPPATPTRLGRAQPRRPAGAAHPHAQTPPKTPRRRPQPHLHLCRTASRLPHGGPRPTPHPRNRLTDTPPTVPVTLVLVRHLQKGLLGVPQWDWLSPLASICGQRTVQRVAHLAA